MSNFTILNPVDSHNTDGIDIDSTQQVLIENGFIDVGDDNVAVKSGIDYFGRKYGRPSMDIRV